MLYEVITLLGQIVPIGECQQFTITVDNRHRCTQFMCRRIVELGPGPVHVEKLTVDLFELGTGFVELHLHLPPFGHITEREDLQVTRDRFGSQ